MAKEIPDRDAAAGAPGDIPGATGTAVPERHGRYGYMFDDAAADHRLGIAPALAALGAAAAPELEDWRARMEAGGAAEPAAYRWIASRFAAWLSAPHALRPAEDDADILPAPDGRGALAPLDRLRVCADLVNGAPGLPDPSDTGARAALHALLHRLCDPDILAETRRLGAPLQTSLTLRSGPVAPVTTRPPPVALEVAVALLGVIDPDGDPPTLLQTGYRLSLPTAQGVRVALGQAAARMGAAGPLPDPADLALGPDASILHRHDLDRHTPLGWYLIREACATGPAARLGPLGSRLLAETVIGAERLRHGAAAAGTPMPEAQAAAALDALWRGRPDHESAG